MLKLPTMTANWCFDPGSVPQRVWDQFNGHGQCYDRDFLTPEGVVDVNKIVADVDLLQKKGFFPILDIEYNPKNQYLDSYEKVERLNRAVGVVIRKRRPGILCGMYSPSHINAQPEFLSDYIDMLCPSAYLRQNQADAGWKDLVDRRIWECSLLKPASRIFPFVCPTVAFPGGIGPNKREAAIPLDFGTTCQMLEHLLYCYNQRRIGGIILWAAGWYFTAPEGETDLSVPWDKNVTWVKAAERVIGMIRE